MKYLLAIIVIFGTFGIVHGGKVLGGYSHKQYNPKTTELHIIKQLDVPLRQQFTKPLLR